MAGASAATLVYGSLTVANRVRLQTALLPIPGWPEDFQGVKIAVLADWHVATKATLPTSVEALRIAVHCNPDYIAIPGDLVAYWSEQTFSNLLKVLEPLRSWGRRVIVSPGNHDHYLPNCGPLGSICDAFGFTYLQNANRKVGGIHWIGIDSMNRGKPNQSLAFEGVEEAAPSILLWHEGDAVDQLQYAPHLMIAGHSHGGQFTFPWGWTPLTSSNGSKYLEGFYLDSSVPLYVSRGIGTTGFPSRLGRLPEVSLLCLVTDA